MVIVPSVCVVTGGGSRTAMEPSIVQPSYVSSPAQHDAALKSKVGHQQVGRPGAPQHGVPL